MLPELISYEAVSWFMWIPLMLARFGEFSEGCIQPELQFPAGDVLSIVGAKAGTTLAHDLECFHYLFSHLIN